MRDFAAASLAGFCGHAMAGMDNHIAAAQEAGYAFLPAASWILGLAGAAWLGYAGLEDGKVVTGAAVGFALGSLAGLIVSFLLR